MLTSTAARVLLRRALPAATATSSSAASAAVGPVRCLNLHEYQSAKIMADSGVNVPFGASFLFPSPRLRPVEGTSGGRSNGTMIRKKNTHLTPSLFNFPNSP